MASLLDRGPPELQRWAEQLIARLDDPVIAQMLPPFAVARIDAAARPFTHLLEAGRRARNEHEFKVLFSLASSGIRIAHAVCSPWCFAFTRDVARRARWVSTLQASRKALGDAEAARARADFARLRAGLFDASEGFSVHEIIETHVIVEGLRASMHEPSALALYHAAVDLCRDAPRTLRLLSLLAEQLGIEAAVELAPRLCMVALQYPLPPMAMADICGSIEKWRPQIDRLHAASAERFFSAWRLDANRISRSTRERRTERRHGGRSDRRTSQQGDAIFIREQRVADRRLAPDAEATERQPDQPILEAGGWGETMRPYFDAYEALPDIETRLHTCVHPMHAPSGASGALFMPAWAIYSDGRAVDVRNAPGDLSAYARWVASAIDIVDGIAWLSETPPA